MTVRGGEGGNDQPHSAHQDTFTDNTETIVLPVNQDFTTHYIVPEGDDITTGGLLGATALSPTNPQGTLATVPNTPFGVPAAVGETGGPTDFCPPAFVDDLLRSGVHRVGGRRDPALRRTSSSRCASTIRSSRP